MSILGKVTWKAMQQNKARTVVTIIGIILSAAMFTAVTTLGYSLWSYLVRMEVYNTGDYFLQFDYTTQENVDSLSKDDRVSKLGDLGILGYTTFRDPQENGYVSEETCAVAAGDQAFYDMVSIHLEEGRLPRSSNEIVISRNIYHYLKETGRPCELGSELVLDMVPVYEEYDGEFELPAEGTPLTRTYTIVGIGEHFTRLNDYMLYLSHLFTYTDDADTPLWHRVYLKTSVPKDAYRLLQEMPEGISGSTHDALLEFYGATKYTNYNTIIGAICGVLAAIIMAGSISLIYNAFSISVSERTKQFGLLSSVGATRRQLRGAVFYEAAILSLIGIPLGLLSGCIGIGITLHLLSGRIHTLLATADGTILLRLELSPLALAIAALVALLTVLLSAAIPAGRATRISPMEAIRQKNDYVVPPKNIRFSKASYRLFGLPSVLSRKYYKVSKKKYRATVISLVISIALFISAASVSQLLRDTVDRAVDTENYDMLCYGDAAELAALREQDFIADSVYYASSYYMAHVPDEMLSEGFLDCWDAIHDEYASLDKNMQDIRLVYLEDTVFRRYLAEHAIPAEPYFDPNTPTALVCTKKVDVYLQSSETGNMDRFTYEYDPYDAEGQLLQLFDNSVPSGLDPFEADGPGVSSYAYTTNEQGEPVLSFVPIVEVEGGMIREDRDSSVDFLIRWDTAGSGKMTAGYYRMDPATGAISESPDAVEEMDAPQLRLGATIEDLPFGISYSAIDSYVYNYLILPLSSAPEALQETPDLCITVSDYAAAITYLDSELGNNDYHNYKEGEENNRTLILIINVFSYGFIILISLISVANVFNTISTNVALRKRDFGMLRSIGFRERDLLTMMNYECLTYGFHALLWGIPISLVLSFLIQRIEGGSSAAPFIPPWGALVIAAACVFAVVFTTMFYAISRLRRDNPIEAIRMENL